MPVPGPIPHGLFVPSFSSAQARTLGVTDRQLQGDRFERLAHGYYVLSRGTLTLAERCRGLVPCLPADTAFSHETAAELYGLPVPAAEGVHVSLTPRRVLPQHHGIRAHAHLLPEDEVALLRGLRVTRPERLFLDLAARLSRVELIVLGDAMLNAGLTAADRIAELLLRYPGRRGVLRAANALPLLEPLAESPMETRTRLIYVDGGLPRPEAQIVICDEHGNFVARSDMGWREAKVCSEFEGRQHAAGAQFNVDVRRYTAILALGWLPLRYTSHDVYRRSQRLLAQAEHVLRQRGMDW